MAAAASVDLDRWQGEFSALMARVGTRFGRVEPRRRVSAFVRGLLAGLPRTNCWSIAEHAGDAQPRGMQRLLSAAVWDETGVRDDLRDYVVERLGDPAAVLVVDETGDVKKGTRTVGVQRQYSGTAGRVENCQVSVYLAYTSASGYAFLDRALYLPRAWTEDQSRMDAAGVPEGVGFATKPALAKRMIDDALAAGAPAAWVAGDEVYGADPDLRRAIAARGVGFVLAVAKSHRFTTGIGDRTAIDIAVRLPRRAWQRLSAGDGAKGPRRYDWAWVTTTDPALTSGNGGQTVTGDGKEWLLIRRTIRTGEHAFYRAHTPGPVSLAALVRVAGARWKVEESFAGGRGARRPGRAPSPNLDLLAPLDRPGHARSRLPVRAHRHPTRTGRLARVSPSRAGSD